MSAAPNPREFLSPPHDRIAWFAVGLAIAFFAVFGINIASGSELAFLMFLAMLVMVAGLVLAIISILRHGERSFLLMLPLLTGASTVLFFLVELLAGHE